VRAFPSLVYPHKPVMAEWLNEWAAQFAAANPDVLATATFFPEPGVERYVSAALSTGARVFKSHLQVGGYDPRDPLLDPVWGTLAEAAVPVVVHAGGGPVPGRFTGPGPFGDVLARHPRLTAVIAHMGMPEYEEFLGFAERYPNVYLDTTMCFVRWFDGPVDPPPARIAGLRDKVLLGSDFPNIPYPYARQLQALGELDLGEDWLRAVCWENAAQLFGVSDAVRR
jgi:predicted TIM-barrel fold metal-dependent hydrolase